MSESFSGYSQALPEKKLSEFAKKARKYLDEIPDNWEPDIPFPQPSDFDEIGRIAAPTPRRPHHELVCFRSAKELKNYLGPAGEKREWHHIVEERLGENATFPIQMINCTDNIINLPEQVHRWINEQMSARSQEYGVSHLRDEVGTWPFQEQYNFGVEMIRRAYKETGVKNDAYIK